MQAIDFLGISIVGVALSFLIEVIKSHYGTESSATKGITLTLAIVFGTGYYFLQVTPFFPTVIGVLAVASTFYAFFLKK
jgi:hypothetical protein